ncbi:thioredoxin fold domain-containing protein [Candidatus Sumerlaeota bacterium]
MPQAKIRNLGIIPVLASLLLASVAFGGGEGWTDNMEQAMATAAKEKKDLLLDFTGSDWCGWCIKLKKEVFSQQAFKKEAPKHFVLVVLDFPRDKSKLSQETIQQNEFWKNKLGIRGYPTIYLADETGRPYAQTGYQAGGPEAYLKHLAELRAVRAKRDASLLPAAKAKGLAKAKLLDQALSAMDGDFVPRLYRAEIAEIITLDPDNKAGLRAKYQAQGNDLEQKRQQQEFMSKLRGLLSSDPEGAIKAIDQQLAKDNLPVDMRKQLLWTKASVRLSDPKTRETGLKLLDELIAGKVFAADDKLTLRERKAQALAELKRLDEALKIYDELLLETANKPARALPFFVGKAQLLSQAERFAEALEVYTRAAQLKGLDSRMKPMIDRFRAEMMFETKAYDDAIVVYNELLADKNLTGLRRADILVGKAEALQAKGDQPAALILTQQATKLLDDAPAPTSRDRAAAQLANLRERIGKITQPPGE